MKNEKFSKKLLEEIRKIVREEVDKVNRFDRVVRRRISEIPYHAVSEDEWEEYVNWKRRHSGKLMY